MPTNFARLALVRDVCDQAWEAFQAKQKFPSLNAAEEARIAMAGRVMAAVVAGERDQDRLLAIALETKSRDAQRPPPSVAALALTLSTAMA